MVGGDGRECELRLSAHALLSDRATTAAKNVVRIVYLEPPQRAP
jgi:hypothetical protein